MNIVSRVIAVAMLAGAVSATAVIAAPKTGKCVMAGGESTMATEDLARYMANAALKNSIAAHGWTAHGTVKVTCDAPYGLPHCLARQKACG